jgi:hypothetical protein
MREYPEAKVILTVRGDSAAVCRSAFDTIYSVGRSVGRTTKLP